MEHITLYREPGRYAGWPANYGIWAWGDEVVVGFTAGYHDSAGGFHARDRSRPFVAMQARSRDGGHTWQVAPTPCRTPGSRGLSADEHVRPELWTLAAIEQGLENAPTPCPGGVNFTHPDFALMCGRTGLIKIIWKVCLCQRRWKFYCWSFCCSKWASRICSIWIWSL